MPHANTVNLALAKQAKPATGREMPGFFAGRLQAAGGNPADSLLVRFGAETTVGGC